MRTLYPLINYILDVPGNTPEEIGVRVTTGSPIERHQELLGCTNCFESARQLDGRIRWRSPGRATWQIRRKKGRRAPRQTGTPERVGGVFGGFIYKKKRRSADVRTASHPPSNTRLISMLLKLFDGNGFREKLQAGAPHIRFFVFCFVSRPAGVGRATRPPKALNSGNLHFRPP